MKHYLLAALLITASLRALGQVSPTPATGSIEALDVKNGFRGYKLGTPLSELPQLQKRGKHYVDHMEPLLLDGIDLDKLEFYFDAEKKLCSILLSATSTSQPSRLFEKLVAEYGSPQMLSDSKWVWAGKRVTMTYTQIMLTANVGYVGIPVKNAVVTIDSNEEVARRQAQVDKKAGPKQPSVGL